jgi:hypothetical protein
MNYLASFSKSKGVKCNASRIHESFLNSPIKESEHLYDTPNIFGGHNEFKIQLFLDE